MGTFYRSRHELIFAFKNGTAPHINSFELGQHGRYRRELRAGVEMANSAEALGLNLRSGVPRQHAHSGAFGQPIR